MWLGRGIIWFLTYYSTYLMLLPLQAFGCHAERQVLQFLFQCYPFQCAVFLLAPVSGKLLVHIK